MKTEIHPDYVECRVTCSCGNQFVTRATVGELRVELCAECHPFYTGKQKLVDTGGRVERFQRRYAQAQGAPRSGEGAEGRTSGPEGEVEGEGAAPKRKKRAAEAPKRKPPVATKGGPRPKLDHRGRRDDEDGRGRGRRAQTAPAARAGEAAEPPAEAPAEASETEAS